MTGSVANAGFLVNCRKLCTTCQDFAYCNEAEQKASCTKTDYNYPDNECTYPNGWDRRNSASESARESDSVDNESSEN